MRYLSLCTIAKGEYKYIKDWCAYHLGLRVDHIFVYDNEDTPLYERLLRPYFSAQQLSVIHYPGTAQQCPAITHCLNNNKNSTRWLGFIDVDEYVMPYKTDSLQELLAPYERYSALGIHWKLFGSNGHVKYEPLPVPERFTKCANIVDRHIKSFVDPKRTISWVTVHKFREATPAVDEYCREIPELESRPEPATADIVGLAHYVTKSYDECCERRGRLRADIPEKHKMPEFFHAHDKNEVEDFRALELWKKYGK